jgi:membrane dipeptidase
MLPRALAVYRMTTNVTSGMMVDLSHVSPEAAEQGLKCTDAPVMFSHSNARGVFDCPRNVPDSVLDLVPANNGIVMVTFVPEHLPARRSEATMDMLLDHIFYIANRIGWEHVGLGSDFDGEYYLSVRSSRCR